LPDPTDPPAERTARGVALQVALEHKDDRELSELLSFWDGQRSDLQGERGVAELRRRMSNEKTVRKRVKFLSKKLVDLLKFFLRGNGYRADLAHVTVSQAFSYLSPFELKAAVNALIKRGFLFDSNGHAQNGARKTNGNGSSTEDTFLVPCELGDVLQAFIWDDDRTVEEIFSLKGQLARLVDRRDLNSLVKQLVPEAEDVDSHAHAAELLSQPEAVTQRLDGIPEKYRSLLKLVVETYGGITSRAVLQKNHKGLARWNRKELQDLLEGQLLGTVRHVSLGEFGIHQFDEAVVIYAELLPPLRTLLSEETPQIDTIRGLGVDLISDISAFLSYIEHNPIKLTLSGKVYRTAVRKLEDSFILARTSGFPGDWLFQYLYDFCNSQSMIARGENRSVTLTIKGRSWDRTPLDRKLSRLLKFSCGNWTSTQEPFHGKQLLDLYLDAIRKLPLGEWVDINAPAFDARSTYLANLDHFGVRDRFQSRFQFAQQSGMRDPHQLALELTGWARHRLVLFGMLDLGEHDGKPAAMRLTSLGAKALGLEVKEGEGSTAPLIVNPDFEVILYPDGSSYDLITDLDRFAERITSDSAYRYRLTAASIEKAVAEGLEPASILKTLSENSRVDVPQNVIYSIGQWAGKVKFVQQTIVSLVRGRNKEVIDRILHDEALRPHVLERLSPTAVLLSRDLPLSEFARLLESVGIFLEGDGDQDDGEAAGGTDKGAHDRGA
jgi:hypothetical protein